MDSEAWISVEPRVTTVVQRVVARAARRPALVLVLVMFCTGLIVAYRVLRPPTYVATMSFRLAEGGVSDPNAGPRPPRAIGQYIGSVALSRSRLQRIMEEHRWSSAFLARDSARAVEEFRSDIRIDVSRNYFIYDRSPHDEPRSAQVSISLRGSDPEKTRDVLHDIGQAMLQEQAEHRKDRLVQATQLVEAQLGQARARAKSMQSKIAELRREASQAGSRGISGAAPRVAPLLVESQAATEQILALEQLRDELEFSTTAESANLGLNFELYDESLVAAAPPLTSPQTARLAMVTFAILMMLAVPIVGAFNDRIYSTGDLAFHSFPVFGEVGRFPGDEAGAFRSRTKSAGI
jgi:hypothetical protein